MSDIIVYLFVWVLDSLPLKTEEGGGIYHYITHIE